VEGLRARIEAIVDQLLQQIGTHDFMEDFAYPLPVIVIAELLGLPPSGRGDLKRWSDDVALLLDPFPPAEAIDAYRHSIMEFNAYAVTQFEARRRSPRDDLLSALVRARDGEDALSDVELFSMLVLLVAAGHETTTNLLGNAVIALTQRPDQVPRLLEDPVNGVEELLRFDSPVQRTSRVVLEPFPLGEFEAAPGDLLFLVLGAANRDPDHFPDPGRLDLTRANAGEHLSFGHGVHHCLGAPLARLEAQIALPRLYSRHPGLAADLDRIEWRPSIVLRGPKRLPITL
jgi:cytochrome P450